MKAKELEAIRPNYNGNGFDEPTSKRRRSDIGVSTHSIRHRCRFTII